MQTTAEIIVSLLPLLQHVLLPLSEGETATFSLVQRKWLFLVIRVPFEVINVILDVSQVVLLLLLHFHQVVKLLLHGLPFGLRDWYLKISVSTHAL